VGMLVQRELFGVQTVDPLHDSLRPLNARSPARPAFTAARRRVYSSGGRFFFAGAEGFSRFPQPLTSPIESNSPTIRCPVQKLPAKRILCLGGRLFVGASG
jgi:hypothetical protein